MADETLRLRTVVVSDEAVANIRLLGRELGIVPRQAKQSVDQLNREFRVLSETIKGTGAALRQAIPGLGTMAFTAAGAGFAATQAAKGVTEFSKALVDLSHTSREMGLTTQQLRGIMVAAERVAIAPEGIANALANFKRNTEDFKLRIGSLREELDAMGAGPLASRLVKAKDQFEALQQLLEFKDAADKWDETGATGRRVMEKITGDANVARLKMEDLKTDIAKEPTISDEEMARIKRYNDLIINLGRSWRRAVEMGTLRFFDNIEHDLKGIQWLKDRFKELEDRSDEIRRRLQQPPGPGGGMKLPPSMFRPRGRRRSFQHGGMVARTGLAYVHAGEKVVPAGGDFLKGSDQTLTKTHTKAVYDAMVQFAHLQQGRTGGAGGGPGGGGPGGGGPGGGGPGGGGGFGGGSLSGGAPSGGRPSGSTVTPSDNEKARQTPAGVTPVGDPGRQGALRTVKGSVFGTSTTGPGGFTDRSEPAGKLTASGIPNTVPGIATPGSEGLGQMHEVITPDGRRFLLPKIDKGPAAFTGRGVDINAAAAEMMGYNAKNFPTDKQFQVGRSGPERPYKYKQVDTSGAGPIATAPPSGQTPSDAAKAGEVPGQGSGPGSGLNANVPRIQASTGDPAAFITHHTGGRGTVAGVQETLRKDRHGVQYIMDREGKIHVAGGPGESHMKPGWGPMGQGLSNRNVVGMEIIAKSDKDVTPAQAQAYAEFMAKHYPNTPIFGHGQVNPGHKEADEGMTAKRAAEALRAKIAKGQTGAPQVAEQGAAVPEQGFGEEPPPVSQRGITEGMDRGDQEQNLAERIKGRAPALPKMTPKELNEFMGGGGDAPKAPPPERPPGSPDPRFGGPGDVFGPEDPSTAPYKSGRGRGGLGGIQEIDPTVPGGVPWMNEMQRRKFLTESGASKGTEGPEQQDPDLSPDAMRNRRFPGAFGGTRISTRRLDVANDARTQYPQKTGTIGVQVRHNGTEAKTTAKGGGDLIEETKVKTNKQPQAQAESGPGV